MLNICYEISNFNYPEFTIYIFNSLFNLTCNEFRTQFTLNRYLYRNIRYSYQSSNKVARGTPSESEIDFKEPKETFCLPCSTALMKVLARPDFFESSLWLKSRFFLTEWIFSPKERRTDSKGIKAGFDSERLFATLTA